MTISKEELKCSILRQFKDSQAPIRTLMYAESDSRFDVNSVYRGFDSFFFKEHEIVAHLETTYSAKSEEQFQIKFEPYEQNKAYKPMVVLDKSKTINTSFIETISFDGDYIVFGLTTFDVVTDDVYHFEKKNEYFGYELFYDIVTGTFIVNAQDAVWKKIQKWKLFRNSPRDSHLTIIPYVEFVFTRTFRDELTIFLKFHQSEKENSDKVRSAFEDIKSKIATSAMEQIVNALV